MIVEKQALECGKLGFNVGCFGFWLLACGPLLLCNSENVALPIAGKRQGIEHRNHMLINHIVSYHGHGALVITALAALIIHNIGCALVVLPHAAATLLTI
ncbi:hypothetical protein SE18_14815 [Herpetosiphon geysericola]|uniref:Uncharacterized protein n=1 Tax=Herpetosiphon geysericola TaxID=70996 RepID=A0A0P6XSV1_9CHLR|nr:hypothetical protein SE18_14815 [Herpetosiphon geysericola]